MKDQNETMKYFKVVSLGETSYTWAPSRQSLMEDMQRMGILDSETIVEEANPSDVKETSPTNIPKVNSVPVEKKERIFTIPGGKKLKEDENGTLYSLEWEEISIQKLIERAGCVDLEIPKSDNLIKMLDWVELKEEEKEEKEIEGEENATEANFDV